MNVSTDFDYHIIATCSSTTSDCINATLTDSVPAPLVIVTVDAGPDTAVMTTPGTNPTSFTVKFQQPLAGGGVGPANGAAPAITLTVKFPAGRTRKSDTTEPPPPRVAPAT